MILDRGLILIFEPRDENGSLISGGFGDIPMEDFGEVMDYLARLPHISYHSKNKAGTKVNPFMSGSASLPSEIYEIPSTYPVNILSDAAEPPFRYRYEINNKRYYGEFSSLYPENDQIQFSITANWLFEVALEEGDSPLELVPKRVAPRCAFEIAKNVPVGDFLTEEGTQIEVRGEPPYEFGPYYHQYPASLPTTVTINFADKTLHASASGSDQLVTADVSFTLNLSEYRYQQGILTMEMDGEADFAVTMSVHSGQFTVNNGLPFSFNYSNFPCELHHSLFAIKPKPYVPETNITYIDTTHDFLNMRSEHGHYVQTSDLDMSGIPLRSLAERTLGKTEPFTGWYDGGGHTISGLGGGEGDAPSMFGYIVGGHIENLVLDDVNFSGRTRGALATYCSSAVFNRVAITGQIRNTLPSSYHPSFDPGSPYNTIFDYINNSAGVGSFFHCGGRNDMGSEQATMSLVLNCYAKCKVEMEHLYAGAPNNPAIMSSAGGLFGYMKGIATTSYSASALTVANGQLPRYGIGSAEAMFVYYDSDLAGVFSGPPDDGEPRTTAQMTYPYDDETTYIMWDWDNVWKIDEYTNDGYPYLFDTPIGSVLSGESEVLGHLRFVFDVQGALSVQSSFMGHLKAACRASGSVSAQSSYLGHLRTALRAQGTIGTFSRFMLGLHKAMIFAKTDGEYLPVTAMAKMDGEYRPVLAYTKKDGVYVPIDGGNVE